MDHHQGESPVHVGSGLPVSVAQHAAAIRGVHFHRIGNERKAEGRTRQVASHDGLQVPVD